MNKPFNQWQIGQSVHLTGAFFINERIGLDRGEVLTYNHLFRQGDEANRPTGLFKHEKSGLVFLIPIEFFL